MHATGVFHCKPHPNLPPPHVFVFLQTGGRQHNGDSLQPRPGTTSLAHSPSVATQEPSMEAQVCPNLKTLNVKYLRIN